LNLDLSCPHCGEQLSIPGQYAGQPGACKKCGGKFTVPIPQAQMQAPPVATIVAKPASKTPWATIAGGVVAAVVIVATIYVTKGRPEAESAPTVAPARATNAAAAEPPPPPRNFGLGKTVAFPTDRIVGKWSVRPIGSTDLTQWNPFEDAQGAAFVPAGMELGFGAFPNHGPDLAFLKDFGANDIQGLLLTHPAFGNQELSHIAHYTGLRDLDITNTAATGAGLRHLASMSELAVLGLGGTGVDDASLAHLSDRPKLWSLTVNDTTISDAGLAVLGSLPALTRIAIANSRVTGSGLARFRTLRSVTISPAQATNDMLRALQSLPNLARVVILDAPEGLLEEARAQLPGADIRDKETLEPL